MAFQSAVLGTADLTSMLTARNVLLLVFGWIVYLLYRAVWNLFYHPLSHIPGPRLAAATYLPEFWYDVVKFGRYTKEIAKMHDIYGPIIRINPDEVHCNDAQFIDEIYASGNRKRDKPLHQIIGSTMEESFFATAGHDQHRMRRAPLAKLFSRNQVMRLEPGIHQLVQRFCSKLLDCAGSGQPINTQTAYSCFTSDVISDYCFGESFGFLNQESWEPNFREPLYSLLQTTFLFRFFPFLKHTALASSWFVNYLSKDMALLIRTLDTDIPNQIRKAQADLNTGRAAAAAAAAAERPTVFGEVLSSDLPAADKTLARLRGEAAALLGGGTETASWTLAVVTYHVLHRPAILARLTAELRGAGADDARALPPWAALERVPYLAAVLHEGLRLSYGISTRTARVAPDEDLVYRGVWSPPGAGKKDGGVKSKGKVEVQYVIPRGYGVGMSNPLVHHDESVFPDSHAFVPERWLDEDGQMSHRLDRYLLSFSKGSRICPGMNLALCELYLALAALTLRVFPHMRLFETTEEDVKYDHDMIVPLVRDESKGVRVLIV
ncbi:cytochrome P450 [Hypoxylon sp. FL1284]|nr:cytochrome P450 [Hypoxylon sp. FL1284]